MKKTKIHRYAYLPNLNVETKEYSWRKLKVVKVWVKPTFSSYGNPIEVIYVLENCLRVSEHNLLTEEKIKTMSPKLTHNNMLNRIMNDMSGFHSRTIFQPNTEMTLRNSGEKMNELIKESNELIKDCIDNDYILGEENVTECINEMLSEK